MSTAAGGSLAGSFFFAAMQASPSTPLALLETMPLEPPRSLITQEGGRQSRGGWRRDPNLSGLECAPGFNPRVHVVRPLELIEHQVAGRHVDSEPALILRTEFRHRLGGHWSVAEIASERDAELGRQHGVDDLL